MITASWVGHTTDFLIPYLYNNIGLKDLIRENRLTSGDYDCVFKILKLDVLTSIGCSAALGGPGILGAKKILSFHPIVSNLFIFLSCCVAVTSIKPLMTIAVIRIERARHAQLSVCKEKRPFPSTNENRPLSTGCIASTDC